MKKLFAILFAALPLFAWADSADEYLSDRPALSNAISRVNFRELGQTLSEQSWMLGKGPASRFYSDPRSMHWDVASDFRQLVTCDTNGNWVFNEWKEPTRTYVFAHWPFRPPAGSTQIVVTATARAIYGTNSLFTLGLDTPSTLSVVGGANYEATADGTNISWTYNTVSADVGLFVQTKNAAAFNSSISLSNLTLSFLPAPTNAGLASGYVRHDVLPRHISQRSFRAFSKNEFYSHGVFNYTPASRIKFNTSATNFTVESVAMSTHVFYVYTNGALCRTFTPTANVASEYWDVTLTARNTDVEIVIPTANQQSGTGEYDGGWVRGIFCAGDAYFKFAHADGTPRVWVLGDSISSYTPGQDGIWANLSYRLGLDYELYGAGSWSLTKNFGEAHTNLFRSYAASRASMIWLGLGYNDYNGNLATTNAFATNYALLLDTLHFHNPGATIFCQSPMTATTETANGGGYTLAQFRAAIQGVAASRASFAVYVPGTSLVGSSSLLADGIHPSALGSQVFALNAVSYLETMPNYTAPSQLTVDTLTLPRSAVIKSNYLSTWPTAPASYGDAMLVNSNGIIFLLSATNTSSLTWTKTNRLTL